MPNRSVQLGRVQITLMLDAAHKPGDPTMTERMVERIRVFYEALVASADAQQKLHDIGNEGTDEVAFRATPELEVTARWVPRTK